ncbi:MAG: hypothetical protein QOF49_490 [Chloroflexota bacterium]|nr:hypothetical protein [Chloroflexota bacterium]
MNASSRTARRGGSLRKAGWLTAAAMLAIASLAPASALAVGPGNNGADATGNGTTSDATVDGSLSGAGGSATLQADAKMFCSGTSVGLITGTFTLTKDLDVGSVITLYLVPNNGSNADPAANVTKNEVSITLTDANNDSGDIVAYSLAVTHAFTVSSGGILVVFAVNSDNTTVISSSKSNSLNCTEATPSESPSEAPSVAPSDTPSESPSEAPSVAPSETPSVAPSEAPSVAPSEAPSGSELPIESDVPSVAPSGSEAPIASEQPTGGVEGATGVPGVTPPPTDTLAANQTANDAGWRAVLIGLATVLITALAFTQPRRSSNRR